MTDNPLMQLHALGQSVWLDQISRRMITSGELHRLIAEDDLRGMTSNPTIFQKAIAGGSDYDETIKRLAEQNQSAGEMMDALIAEDIRMALDAFRPLYDRTRGADGFVSIEVNPELAHDTQRTIAEARRLAQLINRPNVMVKIPGTREGLPAIRQMIAEGYNINITLLFAVERYVEVIDAYLSGLEERVRQGQAIDHIASVASFFVSRVDTAVDKLLEAKLQAASPDERRRLEGLLGQAAVANAKLAYQRFQQHVQGQRFAALQAKGANVQRVLWASTSAKNPRYRDVMYVEELIGPHTVNTLPQETLQLFRDHGRVAPTLEQDPDGARRVFHQLASLGIDIKRVTQELEQAGVQAFIDSFRKLLEGVGAKRDLILTSA